MSRGGVIYSGLFKYTDEHTACFTENNWAPHLSRMALVRSHVKSEYEWYKMKLLSILAYFGDLLLMICVLFIRTLFVKIASYWQKMAYN